MLEPASLPVRIDTRGRGRYMARVTALPSPELPFDVLATPRLLAPGHFELAVPDGWQQGRGAFGGLVVAALIRALEAAGGAGGRTLRSLTAELCGPTLPGPAELRVEVLREGSNVSTLAVRLLQGGQVQAHAVGVLGRPRAGDRDHVAARAPTHPDWRTLEPLPIGPPAGPDFARYWDYRCEGALPFTGRRADACGWIRPRRSGRRDAAFVAACADAWWPALFSAEELPRPMASVAFTFQLLADPAALDPEAPLLHFARDVAVHQGYAVELRELWTEHGVLVALNQQTIAIIK